MIRRRGMSFLEVLIAAAILGLVGIGVLTAFVQSAKEVRTTSEHTLALFLSQKVMEEVMHETMVDPAAHAEDIEPAAPRSLTKDPPPYFSTLEDSAAPWGRLDPATDLKIDPQDPQLMGLYARFSFGLDAMNASFSPEAATKLLRLRFQWARDTDHTTEATMGVETPVASSPRSEPPEDLSDDARLSAAIRDLLYPGKAPRSLQEVVADVGAALTTVRDVGTVVATIESFRRASQELDPALNATETRRRKLEEASSGGPADRLAIAHESVTSGKLHEMRAAMAWQTLLGIREALFRAHATLTGDSLRLPDVDGPGRLRALVSEGIRLRDVMDRASLKAVDSYYAARAGLPEPGVSAFWRLNLDLKILELAKLRALLVTDRELGFLRRWIEFLEAEHTGRNRVAGNLVQREKKLAVSIDAIGASHPTIVKRLADAQEASQLLEKLRDRIDEEYLRLRTVTPPVMDPIFPDEDDPIPGTTPSPGP